MSDQHPLTFFKATSPATYLFAARAGRIAMDGDHNRLALIRNREQKQGPSGGIETVTKGGVLAAQINVAPVVGSSQDEQSWTDALRRLGTSVPAGRLRFRPLGLRNARMTISGLEGLVADPSKYRDVPVGLAASVPITLPLTDKGADTLWGILGSPVGFPINVTFNAEMDVLYPGAHYRITANTEQVYKFFSLNTKARASYFGLVGGNADVSVVRRELIGSGAVRIDWLARPEGFDESRVAQMQNSILDAFAKSALDLMVAEVVPDTTAPNPSGFFGGVSVKLKDIREVKNLNLSGEFKQNDLRTQTFSFPFSFAQLGNLNPKQYGVDIAGDNKIPITLNLGKDPKNVQKYLCQYGYRRPNGTVQGGRAEAKGADGLLLKGVVQWDPRDPRPKTTEIQFAVDWENLEWEDYATKLVRENGDSGVLFQFTPGNHAKNVALVCDFTRGEPGTFAAIEWRTVLPPNPDGTQPKNYSGGVVYEGSGPSALPDRLTIEFPYNNETVKNAKFEWEATLVKPDGTVLGKQVTEELEKVSTVLAVRALLRPVAQDSLSPRMAAALRLRTTRPLMSRAAVGSAAT